MKDKVKRKVFQQQRDAGEIPGQSYFGQPGRSFHRQRSTTEKSWHWDKEVSDQGIKRLSQSAERSGREEWAESGLHIKSHRYLGAEQCRDIATKSRTPFIWCKKVPRSSVDRSSCEVKMCEYWGKLMFSSHCPRRNILKFKGKTHLPGTE